MGDRALPILRIEPTEFPTVFHVYLDDIDISRWVYGVSFDHVAGGLPHVTLKMHTWAIDMVKGIPVNVAIKAYVSDNEMSDGLGKIREATGACDEYVNYMVTE